MILETQFTTELDIIISNAIREDVGDGDHSSLACIPKEAQGKAKLLVKDEGIIAGVEFAKMIFKYVDSDMEVETFINDGEKVKYDIVLCFRRSSIESRAFGFKFNATNERNCYKNQNVC
jgi:nicotinate-nucleotide pyrophosphorylase (carboxylating)